MTAGPGRKELLRPWLARAALISAVFLIGWQLSPKLPREQELTFQLPGSAAQKLVVSWQSKREHDLGGGFEINAQGVRRVRHVTSIPNGAYAFTVEVFGQSAGEGQAPESQSFVQHVQLEGGPTTIYLTKGSSW
jgi:hypothetical protein